MDFRQTLRALGRNPVLLIFSVILIGLGIGTVSGLYAILEVLLFRPLPVRQPESIVRVVRARVREGFPPLTDFRHAVFDNLLRAKSLDAVCASYQWETSYSDHSSAERILAQVVSGSYFSVFQVQPILGRVLQPTDDRLSDAIPAVISYMFWQRRYAKDRAIVGHTAFVHGRSIVIVGVLPAEFSGADIDVSPDVRLPIPSVPLIISDEHGPVQIDDLRYEIAARMKRDVQKQVAHDEAYALFLGSMDQILKSNIDAEAQIREHEVSGQFTLEPIKYGVSKLRITLGPAILLLLSVSGILLVLSCINLSGLLTASFTARQSEFALRRAVGASSSRLFQLTLVECSVFLIGGSILGLGLSVVITALLTRALPEVRLPDATSAPLALQPRIDWHVGLFTIVLTAALLVIVAAIPALRAHKTDLHVLLRALGGAQTARLPGVFVSGQVALCVSILVVAGFLALTLNRLLAVNPGYETSHLVTFILDLASSSDSLSDQNVQVRRVLEQVRVVPGVQTASLSARPLMHGTGIRTTIAPAGRRSSADDFMNTSVQYVTDNYFDTIGLKLLNGRLYSQADFKVSNQQPHPLVVNEMFARRFFPGENPIGNMLGHSGGTTAGAEYSIIGVVANGKYRSVREPMQPIMYLPLANDVVLDSIVLNVRTRESTSSLVSPIRRVITSVDPGAPIAEISTPKDDIAVSLWAERMAAYLSVSIAFLAALIVAVGLYAFGAFFVARRAKEIGIRIVQGATKVSIAEFLGLYFGRLVSVGLAIGIAISLPMVYLARSLIYGISRLRVFFAVRDDAKRVARFDLHPGEVQALRAFTQRSLFSCEQIDFLLRDDLSLTVALNASGQGLRFDVQTPVWRSQFGVAKGNELATLAVFARRAINQERVVPVRFGDEANQFSLRKRTDGQVLAEFQHQESFERVPLSSLQLYELEILAQYALHRAFEPSNVPVRTQLPPESVAAAQIA